MGNMDLSMIILVVDDFTTIARNDVVKPFTTEGKSDKQEKLFG